MCCLSFRTKTPQRRYIDRLGPYLPGRVVNWDASENRVIHAGDFGTFDKETGDFVVEGNIYTTYREFENSDYLAALAKSYPTCDGPVVTTTARDRGVKYHWKVFGGDLSTNSGIRDLFTGKAWRRFRTNEQALFFMYRHKLTHLPYNLFSSGLLNKPPLKKKWIVHEVYSCPAYLMYLSDGSDESVNARLRDMVNEAKKRDVSGHVPTINWDGDLEGFPGIIRCGSQPDSDAGYYTPVFNVKWIP